MKALSTSPLVHALAIALVAAGITVDILDEAPTDGTAQTLSWETVTSPQMEGPLFTVDPAFLVEVAQQPPADEAKPLLAHRARTPRAKTSAE